MSNFSTSEILPIPAIGRSRPTSKSTVDRPFIMSGPCSVESRSQIVETAVAIAESGYADALRAGLWKPRTNPDSFEGVGAKGLPWLSEASERSGLPMAVEVASERHVREVLDAGVDMLWIGARTSVNPFDVQKLAETISGINPDIPVFIKNPVNPDLELWIGAFRRFLNAGVRHLGAIHRGFSAYNSAPYRNAPMWQIPMELHRRIPRLPIIHDPSHTGGCRELLVTLSQQALDLGFDGLMIETHIHPEKALSDSGQQVTPAELKRLVGSLEIKSTSVRTESDTLSGLRKQIDSCDNQLLEILARRMELSKEIGRFKSEHKMTVVQPERYSRLLSSLVGTGEAIGLNAGFLTRLLELIHEESVRLQVKAPQNLKDHPINVDAPIFKNNKGAE